MQLLIVKRGALGDVVRTSYFARALKELGHESLQITWLTAPASVPLLRFNSWIDRIVTDFSECVGQHYDRIYSLDDEKEALEGVATLQSSAITGAYLDGARSVYSEDSAPWFDMGLLSRFGKARADALKKENQKGHAEIFCRIFGVLRVDPEFHGDPAEEQWAREWLAEDCFKIAINPFAGGRWPSKELPDLELRDLIHRILGWRAPDKRPVQVILLGAGSDRDRNLALAASFSSSFVRVADTDESVLRLAAIIRHCNALISSDSLALHLGIAQHTPFVAFFAPTSASEIDDFGMGIKVTSVASDYCSYKRDADNRSLTADRIIEAYVALSKRWKDPGVKQLKVVS